MPQYEEIEKAIADGDLPRAEQALEDLPADDATAQYLRGRLSWRKGLKAQAISAYARAAALDPHGPAPVALEQAKNIMDFFHHDLYNP